VTFFDGKNMLSDPVSHTDGRLCPSRGRETACLTVAATNGKHIIKYYKCLCQDTGRVASATQLVANKLFPATLLSPEVAFTFELMNMFDIVNLHSSINIKQFCDSILCLTPEELRPSNEVRVPVHIPDIICHQHHVGNF
jgi:hypothetical protein